jgi:hypothetical protein
MHYVGNATSNASKDNRPHISLVTMVPTRITSDHNDTKEELPLGWTRVKKSKRSFKKDTDKKNEFCCEDPMCVRQPSQQQHLLLEETSKEDIRRGHAIFFFHKIDPEWFQGYFLVDGLKKPWGLLAVQEDVDECLQCSDGGYRQIQLTVIPYPQRKKVTWKEVEWTGGDMMKLSGPKIEFETERCLTGMKAVPLIEQYFSTLIQKLNDEEGCDEMQLKLAPDLAILTGYMKISIPKEESDEGF